MLLKSATMLHYTAFVSRVSFCFWRRENFITNAIHTTAPLEHRIIWRFLRIKIPTNMKMVGRKAVSFASVSVCCAYSVFKLTKVKKF
jgi:hypothetical protein